MEANSAGTALNQTVGQLQGGILRLGIGSAIPVIATWEQTLSASGVPELTPVAQNLSTLRNHLANPNFDPNQVGQLLATLGGQVQAIAATPYGLPIAAPLTQLGLLLSTGGGTLMGQSGG
ncbi:hypothetical protein GBA65_13550 [Rubrobacter marinus]|uniref:Uncharacterized protein n=1 Tax=Rubrobacter marinus TaxID=2653852 RepID=A0A6G8PYU3_9ACTN|nr:hypothetical protein [Rubrobacter marinus]QIN79366.1 hypothetical protein GBA65_13550 [Rubrobacter marinus]